MQNYLVTQKIKINNILEGQELSQIRDRYKLDEDTEYIRKGIVPSDIRFEEGENASIEYITTRRNDRDNEIMVPKGADFSEYEKNRVVLWMHGLVLDQLPVGKNMWIKTDSMGLIAKTKYNIKDEFVRKMYDYLRDDFPLANSIGFVPDFRNLPVTKRDFGKLDLTALQLDPEEVEKAERIYLSWLLLEYSKVPVPANGDALHIAISKSLIDRTALRKYFFYSCGEVIEQKSVIPYKDYGKADENTSWDGPKEVAAAEVEDLKKMCAYVDRENQDTKRAYKIPHHQKDGYKTVLRAVYAGMGALLGARGGVNIPEEDKSGVYSHLAKHYQDFGKEPPELKSYTEEELEKIIHPEKQKENWIETEKTYSLLYKAKKVLENENYQIVPIKGVSPGIQGYVSTSWETHSYVGGLIFPKENWTLSSAKEWLSKKNSDLSFWISCTLNQEQGQKPEVGMRIIDKIDQKAGRVISGKNLTKIREAHTALGEVIKIAEKENIPSEGTTPEKAITVETLLEGMEREEIIALIQGKSKIKEEEEEKEEEKEEEIKALLEQHKQEVKEQNNGLIEELKNYSEKMTERMGKILARTTGRVTY